MRLAWIPQGRRFFYLEMTMPLRLDHTDEESAFWIVWNPEGGNPKHRHDARGQALREAERLARANPGQQFYVMRADEMFAVNDMRRVLFTEVPF